MSKCRKISSEANEEARDEPALPGLSDVRRTPGYLIRRAHQFATAAYIAELGTDEITGVQFVALVAVADEGGLSGVTIAERIGYDKMTTSQLLRRLEKKGLIDRYANALDRRQTLLRATPLGVRVVRDVNSKLSAISGRLFADMTADDVKIMLELLQKLETAARRNETQDAAGSAI